MISSNQLFLNPGVYIVENDQSSFSRTVFSGVIYLVVGSSVEGPHNAPTLVENVTQFRSVYGNIDHKLERRYSYFHRTCEKLLDTGPVYCLSLLPTDPNIDRLTWRSFSCASHLYNGPTLTTSYREMFDRSGFWRRTTDQISFIVNKYGTEPDDHLLHIVNYGTTNITTFIVKSDIIGMDVAFEDWFDSAEQVPTMVSPKDWPNDYVVRFIAVAGNFTDYTSLSTDHKWGEYFNKDGLIKEQVENFIRADNLTVVADYETSLIPYFQDKHGNDLFIETVINNNTAETGIFCSFEIDRFETDYRNGLVDLIGYNLIQETTFILDFLSYEEVLADTVTVEESKLDRDNNSWGDANWAIGRTNLLCEGFVNNVFLKPLILSQTTSYLISPLSTSSDSYAILKGKKIDLSDAPEYYLDLDQLSIEGTQFVLSVILTASGVDFREGIVTDESTDLTLPEIDPLNEIALGYYKIHTTTTSGMTTTMFPISITEEHLTPSNSFIPGWIPAFRATTDTSSTSRISFITYNDQPTYQVQLRFENAASETIDDYNQNRVLYFYNSLVSRLKETESIILDMPSSVSPGGSKQTISHINLFKEDSDLIVLIEIKDQNANIRDISTLDMGYISIYFSDYELILQSERFATSTNQPYEIGRGGIVGHNSILYQQYYDGMVNTGDRVFREIDTETNVKFRVRESRYELAFEYVPAETYTGKIFISGTEKNDGIYNIVSNYIVDDKMTLILYEKVEEEFLEILTIFDANNEVYLEFSFVGEELAVNYVEDNLGKDAFYKKSTTTTPDSYRQTLEIEKILDSHSVLVDFERYSNSVRVGQFIRVEAAEATRPFEVTRGLGRILDIAQYDLEGRYLYIQADSPIWFKVLNFAIPVEGTSGIVKYEEIISELYLGIDNWVLTYKGTFFTGFNVRKESLPNGTDRRIGEILSLIAPGTGIYKAISNPDSTVWRYLADSYGIGFNQEVKRPLAQICEKHNSFGFINMPSIKQFNNVRDAQFSVDNVFDIDLLVKGGFRYGIHVPKFQLIDGKESTYIAYFFPNIMVEDIDNNRPISVPPAAWSASSFVENKWQTTLSDRYPWTVTAGFQFGQLTDVNRLEYSFNELDLGALHQFNLNPFTQDNNGQFWIYSNNTAYVPTSTLGFINVREALIELERAHRQMLLNFQWQFNTKEVRNAIVKRADAIDEKFKSQNAIATYLNVMDDTNNTPEIIDAGVGVLDTYVEAVQGMGTIILRIQILKTGALASGEFLR